MRGRKFRKGCTQHIYQRAVDKGVIFYTVADRLVFYTTCASTMAKYRIPCYAASIMYTHTHLSCLPSSKEQLESCVRDFSSGFARAYNHEHNRDGELFEKPFGRSAKRTSKESRSNLLYVFNNHVEKKLCDKATQERWAFLAYSSSSHPFSNAISEETISNRLRRAIRLVDRHVAKNLPLKYRDIKSVLEDVDAIEAEQYIDYVISSYKLVDFSYGVKLFGSVNELVAASETVTGDEWDLNEDFYGLSDVAFRELCEFLDKKEASKGSHTSIFKMSNDHKLALIADALKTIKANGAQLARFFHCDLPWR